MRSGLWTPVESAGLPTPEIVIMPAHRGVGSAALGKLADRTSIDFVYHLCAYLPAIGILTAFLPNLGPAKVHQPKPATP